MEILSRRRCLRGLALALPAACLSLRARASDAPSESEAEAIGEIAREFMKKYEVPGLSVAFAGPGGMSHAVAFGMADAEREEKLTPDHLFRIASIAKPLTAVTVYKLIEERKLGADDRIFGREGILGLNGARKLPEGVEEITVHHLLTHTCGGWGNQGRDPMFRHPEMDHRELIAATLREQALEHAPGEHYSYSNFGYCLLGRVIEKISGKGYEDQVRKALLEPCGIKDMKIAGNTLKDRAKGEVIYYGRGGEDPYGMNVRRMDAHGGWLAAPRDIVRIFLRSCGGGDSLLGEESVRRMTTSTKANPGYASGWAVNDAGHRWHSGSLPGTSTIAVRTAGGLCWAGFANSRSGDVNAALDGMMWRMAKAVPAWQA